MTIRRPSPGNSIYDPLIMVGLWCLHGLITWYLSRDLTLALCAVGLTALGVLLTQRFLAPRGSRTMRWRPGLFATMLISSWIGWLVISTFWTMEVIPALAWTLIGFIGTHERERSEARKRKASDIGV